MIGTVNLLQWSRREHKEIQIGKILPFRGPTSIILFASWLNTSSTSTRTTATTMETHLEDPQRKEYPAPFFDLDALQNGNDPSVMSAPMNSQPSQSMMARSLSPGQFDVEMLGNLMSLQELDSPHQISPLFPSQAHFRSADYPNQRSVTDQQLRRSQFQQLQDFNFQIFQQQVTRVFIVPFILKSSKFLFLLDILD